MGGTVSINIKIHVLSLVPVVWERWDTDWVLAIGAKVGNPDKTVFNIAGDGCFRMNMNELATASRYDIPIIQVVFDNHALGMVRQWQTLFYGKRYSSTDSSR